MPCSRPRMFYHVFSVARFDFLTNEKKFCYPLENIRESQITEALHLLSFDGHVKIEPNSLHNLFLCLVSLSRLKHSEISRIAHTGYIEVSSVTSIPAIKSFALQRWFALSFHKFTKENQFRARTKPGNIYFSFFLAERTEA